MTKMSPSAQPRKGLPVLAWVGIGVGVFITLFGGIFVLVWSLTSGAVDAANTFLSHVGKGRYEVAYRAVAPQFRNQHNFKSFQAAMRRYGLHRYKSATWSSREISGSRATLKGTVQTRDGRQLPTTIIVVEAQEKWAVYSLRIDAAGAKTTDSSAAGTPRQIPQPNEIKQLVLKTLLAFNASVQNEDFRAFHASVAQPFGKKFSPAQLKQTFAAFIRKNANIAGIRDVAPVFTQPSTISKAGLLKVKGFYPTSPARVAFGLSYMMERGEWRLMGINISVK